MLPDPHVLKTRGSAQTNKMNVKLPPDDNDSKCNQTLERLYRLGAMFTVDCWLHWSRYATATTTTSRPTGEYDGQFSRRCWRRKRDTSFGLSFLISPLNGSNTKNTVHRSWGLEHVASDAGHCIIKREHEKCMEQIEQHAPNDDLEFGATIFDPHLAHDEPKAMKKKEADTIFQIWWCPWLWDNLTCWQAASVGQVVEVNCPELFSFMGPHDGK
ncbi:Pituitary adenylate cyclase-activating polypeptide type I receptor [Merluccius polli]|uniref:Pituitary adenylate cyclase-activating polypeptide type I receptor n=1 Tax=Merluccius polli TaxID=89951 RepID=A0AA47NR87_MERPO|nr:Pituitary adenylate cyclase-activating polypeptide type I receptor [Merluccius polli]